MYLIHLSLPRCRRIQNGEGIHEALEACLFRVYYSSLKLLRRGTIHTTLIYVPSLRRMPLMR